MNKCPPYDYENWPTFIEWKNPKDLKAVSKLTRGLFNELVMIPGMKHTCVWTLHKQERCIDGKWYPSAYQVYINSKDDYDAALKLCVDSQHFERLLKVKDPKNMSDLIEQWRIDRTAIKKNEIRAALMVSLKEGKGSPVATAKLLMSMLDDAPRKKPVGRPKKERAPVLTEEEADDDAARVLEKLAGFNESSDES